MVIPADWKEVRLGEFSELSLAASKKSRGDSRGKYIIADMGSVSKDGSFLTHKTTDIRADVLRTGDLVMPKDDIGGGQIIGKAVLVVEDERYVLGDHVYRLRLTDGFPAFVRYAINSFKVNTQLRSKVVGSAQLGLGRRSVLEQPISMPPLKEQEAIAEALSDADAAIESLDALITKKRDVKQGTMQQLLTGRTRLPGFNADWKEVRLGDLGVCVRGVSYKGDSDLRDGDTPTTVRLLRSNNVQNSLIQFNDVQYVNHDCVSNEQILRRDDIVICMANGSKVLVGKTGLYKDSQDARYTFGAFMGCFRSLSDQAHAIFVRYLFLTKQYQDYISNLLAGSSINNLTPKSIESLLFRVPPLKEQEAIADALSVMDDELEVLTQQVSKLRMVKEGMMRDLLTGKVRLV